MEADGGGHPVYALTGATGFLGGALARTLVAEGHGVRALVRRASRTLDELGVRQVVGDLADAEALDALCVETDGLFHVAGWYRVGSTDGATAHAVNVEGTRATLEAARRARVPRVVYTSTLAVHSDTSGRVVDESYRFAGEHVSLYDETKAAAHDVALGMAAGGLPVVVVAPGLVYGPGDTSLTGSLVSAVIAGRRPFCPAGGRVCWAHVEDVARGHLLAMRHGRDGETYHLAGPPASVLEGLRVAARVAGTPGPRALPAVMVRAAALVMSGVAKVAEPPAAYSPETLRLAGVTYLGSPAKAERELGWHARSLGEGLAATVAALR